MTAPPGAVLVTPRAYLRRMTAADRDAVFAYFDDPQARRFYPSMTGPEMAGRWIQRNLDRYAAYGFGLWALCLLETGEVIGDCGLSMQQVDDGEELEVGYHVRADQRRRGFAGEAARACLDYGFRHADRDLICSIVHPENVASRAVARRLHARFRPCRRAHGIRDLFYTMREDWNARRSE